MIPVGDYFGWSQVLSQARFVESRRRGRRAPSLLVDDHQTRLQMPRQAKDVEYTSSITRDALHSGGIGCQSADDRDSMDRFGVTCRERPFGLTTMTGSKSSVPYLASIPVRLSSTTSACVYHRRAVSADRRPPSPLSPPPTKSDLYNHPLIVPRRSSYVM